MTVVGKGEKRKKWGSKGSLLDLQKDEVMVFMSVLGCFSARMLGVQEI